MYKIQSKLLKITIYHLPPQIDQSAPAPVTTISPKSSSNFNKDQGEAVDDTLRKVAQMFNQTLLTTIAYLTVTQVQKMTSVQN